MPFYQATVQLNMSSGVSADSVMNTYAFSGSTPATDAPAITTLLDDLYNSLVGFYPAGVAQNGHVIKVINLDDPQPRYPILTTTYNFPSSPAGNPTAAEVCVGVSFQALRQSGIPQARRRGRVFIGPIDASALDNNGLVAVATRTGLVTAFGNFLAAAGASAVVWSVYSRVDQDLYAVDNGWVDNAPDIQRRRGVKSTLRNIF